MNNQLPGASHGAPGAQGPPGGGPDGHYVNDLKSTNSKQLLNAYVYDFLIKSSLPQTAQSFIKEADIPTGAPTSKVIKRPPQKELLPLAISLDAPQGFLYEWWQIFWDVFNARTHRGGSENAQQYYQTQLLRQHKEHALHNSTFHAAHAQAAAATAAGLQPQHQQQALLQQQYQQQILAAQQALQQSNQSPHPLPHTVLQPQHQAQPTPQIQHPSVNGPQPHPGPVTAPTPQGQATPQQVHQGHPALNTGSAASATPVSTAPGGTPMNPQQHLSMQQQQQQQQFPGQFNQFQQPMDLVGGAGMGNSFGQHHNAMGQQPEGGFVMGQHQGLQPSQQQQEVQQHFQQQQNQLFAGQKRGSIPTGMAGGPPNFARVQQAQAQFQMNQLRQQQFVHLQQSQQQFKAPMGLGANGRPPYGQPQAPQQSQLQHTLSSGTTNGAQRAENSPSKRQRMEDGSNKNSPLTGSPQNGKDSNQPSPLTQSKNGAGNGSVPSPLVNQIDKEVVPVSGNGGTSALHDYQMQLLLLERENKKMLSVSKKDSEKKEKGTKKMPPPKNTKNASTPTSGSPAVSSATIPSATNGRNKSTATRRKKRASTGGANNKSEPPTPTTPLTPNPLGPAVTANNTTGNANNASSSSSQVKKNSTVAIPPSKLTKEDKDNNTPSNTSQLTPPNSENAIKPNGDLMPMNLDDAKDKAVQFDDGLSGPNAMNGVSSLGQELYDDFALSDFSNDIPGDGNFNLETFLNSDGGDLGFDNYWRDSVEATD